MPRQRHTHRNFSTIATVVAGIAACCAGRTVANEFVLVRDGRPAATIVTAAAPTDVAAFAAQELQYHVAKITGAVLPIKSDADKVEGAKILVGQSAATAKLGLAPGQFKDQEYLIRFVDGALVLLGKDAPVRANVERAANWMASGGATIPPPPWNEVQATSYAVHDFLERFCDVRWYGPGELQMVVPKSPTLAVQPREIHRAPAFAYRIGYVQTPYGVIGRGLAGEPSGTDMALLWARLRLGGENYSCTHSLYGYYDRFWKKNPECPKTFVAAHPDWFAQGYPGQPPQMCYSNPGLVKQVVEDARKSFDDQKGNPGAQAADEYFAFVPMDNPSWCKCPACQAQLDPERHVDPDRELDPKEQAWHFTNGYASDYLFAFANKVARELAKSHPGKILATIAYSDYAYHPEKVRLEPNISVQLCMHARNWWAPAMKANDLYFYSEWAAHEKGRRLYLWNYYCFPDLMAINGGWHCFPGFSAHTLDRQIKMYAHDGIRGMFMDSLCEQVDAYVTFKLLDDPSLDVDTMLEEFFARYYGAAAEPMKQLYLRIEEIYSTTANYPEKYAKRRSEDHQSEEIAWKYLGTEARMTQLGKLMDTATRLAVGDMEKQRVALFRKAVWNYMIEGRRLYLAKQGAKP